MTHTKLYALLLVAAFALLPTVLADTHAETSIEVDAQAEAEATTQEEPTNELRERLEAIRADKDASGMLYGIQTALDRLRVSFERDEAVRAQRALEMSQRRLAELEAAAERGDDRAADRAARAHERQLAQAQRALDRLETNGDEARARARMEQAAHIRVHAQTQLEHVTGVHERILERQRQANMSEERIEHLEGVFARIATRLERVDAQAEEKRVNARTQTRAIASLSEDEADTLEAEVEARTRLSITLEEREQSLQERLQERNERAQEAIDERANRAREQANERLERQLERVQENLEERRERIADRAGQAATDAVGTVIGVGSAQARLEAAAAQELRLAGDEYTQTTQLYARATADGNEYPRARALIADARLNIADAREQFSEDAYERAQTLARQAREDLRMARSTLSEGSEDRPTVSPEPSDSDMHARATAEVRSAQTQLEVAQEAYLSAEGSSPELNRARQALSQASEHIETARRALSAEEYSAVTRAISQAQDAISTARDYISQHNPETRVQAEAGLDVRTPAGNVRTDTRTTAETQ